MFLISKCFTNGSSIRTIEGNETLTFGWQMEGEKGNTSQSSYKITLLSGNRETLWETEQIQSKSSINIDYNGPKLMSRREYFWKVDVWNNHGEKAESGLNAFETGLNIDDWKAKWIEAAMEIRSQKEEFNPAQIFSYTGGNPSKLDRFLDPPVIFYKEFSTAHKKVARARIYITALGVYEAILNGEKIGDELLAPGFTSYPRLQYYQTHDITGMIKAGDNTVAITVADGWYKGRIGLAGIGHQFGDRVALLAQIEIDYEDGQRVVIGSDSTFKALTGEIVHSDLFIGEKQDHSRGSDGQHDVIEKDYGCNQLRADRAEAVKCIEKIKAVSIIRTPRGETVVDFGRNIAGVVEMTASGNLGDRIELQHAEELDGEGNFFFNLMGQNKDQRDIFILRGGEEETFLPRFTYHGFRYVKVTGYPGEPGIENFTAHVLSSDCERAGWITTSNKKINRLLKNIYHSQQSNFISVPTDCPQREKGGWTGDAQIYAPTAIFNMKLDNFLRRWLENMRLEQYENGQIPGLIPFIESDRLLSGGFGNISASGWSDACITIPWELYVQYEDVGFLRDNYPMMRRWLGYVEKRCASNTTVSSKEHEKYLWDMDFHYGDWFTPSLTKEDGSPDPMRSAKLTSKQVATMYFAHSLERLSRIAEILGEKNDKAYYSELSNKVKAAFMVAYVEDDRKILNDLQGLYALAAHFRMGSQEENMDFINHLSRKIEENGNRLDTGFLSTPILLDTLIDHGRKELAYKLLLQEECPSWLYMVNQGATTIWESWDAIRPDGTRNITSYNHYSLGSVQDFIVRRICGLRKVAGDRGKYIIEPAFDAPFEKISLVYEAPYGSISLEWNHREISVKVPIGARVVLKLPNQLDRELGSGEYKETVQLE